MPEAPEVQNVLQTLAEQVAGHTIVHASITHPKLADNLPAETMEHTLEGQTFRRFLRHGKYLILEMDDVDWICHLRMEGKFMLLDEWPQDEKIAKHIHARFDLDNGKLLCYADTRKFGRMQVYPKAEDKHSHPALAKIGLDVLNPKADGTYLYHKIHQKKIPIKQALLDQHIVAGIGNIYADEILFAARLHPSSICSHLSLEDCTAIMNAAHEIMGEAVEQGGTTIRSFSNAHGQNGSFQDKLKVHTRQGQPCMECDTPIELIKVGQRSTYVCPSCQVLK